MGRLWNNIENVQGITAVNTIKKAKKSKRKCTVKNESVFEDVRESSVNILMHDLV